MRVAIFGAGGVGGYFGARLQGAGEEVVFIARGPHLEAIRARGLRITSPVGDLHLSSVIATDQPATVGPADVVVVAIKTWQVQAAVDGLRELIGPDTFVVPTLNGVDAPTQLAGLLGDAPVLAGLARIIAYIAEPGHVRHVGSVPKLVFGERDSRPSPRAERFRDMLRASGVRAEVPDDMDAAMWQKFLFVVSTGGVGAVTRAPIGTIREVPEARAMLEGAMREIEAVGRALGVRLAEDIVETSMAFLDTLPAEGTASLHRDLMEGRRSELDAWNGAVVRLGREAGVPTPIHEFIYSAMLPLERRARGLVSFG